MDLSAARELDANDPLRSFRERFVLPEGKIYLDGNSLGALPAASVGRLDRVVRREWGEDLIASWGKNHWMEQPARIGAAIAGLIGAAPHEVIAADTVSLNLFKLLAAALAMRPGRRVILSEPGNFPSDLYVAQGLQDLGIAELRLVEPNAIPEALDESCAALLLTHCHYKSAALHDLAGLTRAAHTVGALVVWDLSHSAGAVELDLTQAQADFATGCGYKYLNGGPGAPAFLFAAQRHHAQLRQPLSGWIGHAAPFAFVDAYAPAPGMGRFLVSTPNPMAMAALEEGVCLIAEIGMPALAAKSRRLSHLLIDETLARCDDLHLACPVEPHLRGSHVAFRHAQARELMPPIIAAGVIGDFREPDILRFGLAPAYNSFADVFRAAEIIAAIVRQASD